MKLVSCVVLFLLALSTMAEPAPWYQWRSKLDSKRVCAQTSPGPGWEQDSGPYKDLRCERPAPRKQ